METWSNVELDSVQCVQCDQCALSPQSTRPKIQNLCSQDFELNRLTSDLEGGKKQKKHQEGTSRNSVNSVYL
jgi:hypothetical protein